MRATGVIYSPTVVMASEPQNRFYFNEFEVQTDRRELLNQGEPVEVEPRVFDLLVYLIEHRDAAVSKDELLEAIWPGAYVSDSSLTRCVMKARRAVGDDAEQQALIKTVHGHGYRFIGQLEQDNPTQTAPKDSAGASSTGTNTFARWWTGLAALAVIVIAAALFLGSETTMPVRAEAASVAVLPIKNDTDNSELDWVRLGLMTAISDQIAGGGSLQVIDSDDVVNGLRQLNPNSDGDDFPGTGAAEAAAFHKLGVTYVISASLSQQRGLYRLQAEILAPGEEAASFDVFGDQPAQLAKELSQTLVDNLLQERREADSTHAISRDEFVNEAYVRGIEQKMRGKIENAIHLLSVAVAQEPESFQARRALAGAWLANGEAQRALDEYNALLVQTREQNRRLDEARLLTLIAFVNFRLTNYDEAERLYLSAIDTFEELGLPLLKAKALFGLARVAGQRRELNLERARLEAAARAFDDAGVTLNSGAALLALGNQALDQGEVDAGEQYFSDALRGFRTGGMRNDEAVALFSLSRVAELRGEFERSAQLAESSRDLAREYGRPWTELLGWRRMGMVQLAMGQLAAAESFFKEALRISQRIGATEMAAGTVAQLAEVYRILGRLDEAAQQLNEADVLVEASGSNLGRRWLQIYRGRLALAQGDPENAIALGIDALSEEGDFIRIYRAHALDLLANAYSSLARDDEAVAALRAGVEAAKQMGDQVLEASFASTLGLNELINGKPELAQGYLVLAEDSAPATYYPLILEAALASRQGEPARAAELFSQARRLAADRWSTQDEQWVALFSASSPG